MCSSKNSIQRLNSIFKYWTTCILGGDREEHGKQSAGLYGGERPVLAADTPREGESPHRTHTDQGKGTLLSSTWNDWSRVIKSKNYVKLFYWFID